MTTPKPQPEKFLDLAAEYENVKIHYNAYQRVKAIAIATLQKNPLYSQEVLVNILCESNKIDRETFNFICEIERQHVYDTVSAATKKHK